MTESKIRTGPRKRVAKNRKKAWRKHTDIKDVEDFLEDQRLQQRTGGLVSEKTDENLFFVESKPVVEEKSRNKRKKKQVEKPLKCHRNLRQNSSILSVHSPTYKKPIKKNKRALEKELAERQGNVGPVKRKRLDGAAIQRETYKQQRKKEHESLSSGRQEYDLWSDTIVVNVKSPDDNGHYLTVTKKKRVKCRRTHLAKTPVAAFEVLPAGASYNPSFEDHQNLLKDALVEAVSSEKKENKLKRWHEFSSVDTHEQQADWLNEMSEGLFNEDEKQVISSKDCNVTEDDNVGRTVGKRKTRSQWKMKAKINEMENRIQKGKDMNIKMHQVYRLKAIKNEIKEKEEEMKTKREKRLATKKQLSTKTKQIGPHKYEAVPMSYKLSEELVGSLREFKPEGDSLKECYKGYERRNMIEPRVWKRGTKPRLKTVVKRSHRVDTQGN